MSETLMFFLLQLEHAKGKYVLNNDNKIIENSWIRDLQDKVRSDLT